MSDTNTTPGVLLPCPRCGDAECEINLNLGDADLCTCRCCGEEFTLGEVREIVAAWGPILAWVAAMPKF